MRVFQILRNFIKGSGCVDSLKSGIKKKKVFVEKAEKTADCACRNWLRLVWPRSSDTTADGRNSSGLG